jgi:fermentation-respiration switch protein FrsA (DUF1100 family)
MKIHRLCWFFLLLLVYCPRVITLDDFLFDPVAVDAYLRPEDLTKWGARLIIPASLIEPVVLQSMGNRIYGFFVKGNPDSIVNNTVTIVYFEGKDENINRYWMRIEYLWEMGFNVFIFDYQGYGMSEGSPSGDALFSDGREAVAYVKSRVDIDTARVVYYGFSLGTFVTTYIAAEIAHPAATIIESAPASATALLRDSGLLNLTGSYVVDADFDNVDRIASIGSPLFMMHSRDDDFVVFDRHAPLIWNQAVEPKEYLWVDGAAHDGIPEVLGQAYNSAVIDFVRQYVIE